MAVDTQVIRDEALLDKLAEAREKILREIRKAVLGQDEAVEQVLLSLFVGGHSILTGVPGLAKTLLVKTIANVLDLSFKRIQFTPDLMPADITGTEIIEENRSTGKRELQFIRGPIFANMILADEINRTPPKDAVRAAGSDAGRLSCTVQRQPPTRLPKRRSSCWPRRTRLNSKAPIRCRKRSLTALCSTCGWVTCRKKTKSPSSN